MKIPPPVTKSVEGLKIEDAVLAADRAYKDAVDAGAPQLKILCGAGKTGTNLKKRLVRLLEDK